MIHYEHPHRAYQKPLPTYWWMASWPYLKFILREISSVFVAWFVVVTLLQIRALSNGPAAYREFEEWLRSPVLIALNLVSFLFVLFHAVTWFNLSAKAMVVRVAGKRVPGLAIALPNYVAWVAVSAAVAWILLRG